MSRGKRKETIKRGHPGLSLSRGRHPFSIACPVPPLSLTNSFAEGSPEWRPGPGWPPNSRAWFERSACEREGRLGVI